MAPNTVIHQLDWHIDYNADLAVAYRVDAPRWLALYAFGRLPNGALDLIAFRYEPLRGSLAAVADEVQAAVESWNLGKSEVGLTTRHLRLTFGAGEMLLKARDELEERVRFVMPTVSRNAVRRGRGRSTERDAVFLARLAVEYDNLLREVGRRGGAQQMLADRYGHPRDTVKGWIAEAVREGMWLTSGKGVVGQPSRRAREMAASRTRGEAQ